MDKFSKDVCLKFKTVQFSDGEKNSFENTYYGKLFYKDNVYHIFYEEDDEGTKVKSSINATHNYVEINRCGGYGARIVYEALKPYKTMYNTPFGKMPLVVKPSRVLVALGDGGGKICLDYEMNLSGQEFKNEIVIMISES